MRREPPSHQRRVALASVDVDLFIGVLAVAVDDVFAVEGVVLLKRFVCSKAVGIDGERLLLAVGQQESNRRFVCGFRWDHVPLFGASIDQNEHGWFVVFVRSSSARGQATRARLAVPLSSSTPQLPLNSINTYENPATKNSG